MGKTLGMQQGMEGNNAALLATLQQHSQSAAGQMQAIQASHQRCGMQHFTAAPQVATGGHQQWRVAC